MAMLEYAKLIQKIGGSMGTCCVECFEEEIIVDFILSEEEFGDCDYCGAKGVSVSNTEIVGDFLRDGILRAYENVNDFSLPTDSDDLGDTVFEVVNQEGCFSEKIYSLFKEKELFRNLLEDSGPSFGELQDGDIDPLEAGDAIIVMKDKFYGPDENVYNYSWEAFKYHVKHYSRFFDSEPTSGNVSREALLGPIAELLNSVETILPVGKFLWRACQARETKGNTPQEIMDSVGPPPIDRSAHNRMSPAGISYMYAGDVPETCIAEIKPSVGDDIWLGQFALIKELKLLDLSKIPAFKFKSIFDESYNHDITWASGFMKHFTTEISKPFSPDVATLEYIPTQLLSEFIRSRGYDGLTYASSQCPVGFNYTLFCGPRLSHYSLEASPFMETLVPFKTWLQLVCFKTIRIEGVTFSFLKSGEKTFKVDDFNDDSHVTFDDINIMEVYPNEDFIKDDWITDFMVRKSKN